MTTTTPGSTTMTAESSTTEDTARAIEREIASVRSALDKHEADLDRTEAAIEAFGAQLDLIEAKAKAKTEAASRRTLVVDLIVRDRTVLPENGGITTRNTVMNGTARPLPAPVQTCAECDERLLLVYTIPCAGKCCDIELCLGCAAAHGYPLD